LVVLLLILVGFMLHRRHQEQENMKNLMKNSAMDSSQRRLSIFARAKQSQDRTQPRTPMGSETGLSSPIGSTQRSRATSESKYAAQFQSADLSSGYGSSNVLGGTARMPPNSLGQNNGLAHSHSLRVQNPVGSTAPPPMYGTDYGQPGAIVLSHSNSTRAPAGSTSRLGQNDGSQSSLKYAKTISNRPRPGF
jgi:hypothetical protein